MHLISKCSNELGLLYGLLLSGFLLSCSNNSTNEEEVFKALEESLIGSNEMISRSSEMLLASINDKKFDPATSVKAQIWYPKAQMVRKHSSTLLKYIENLKVEVKEKAFLGNDKVNELFDRLSQYRKDIMLIDSGMAAAFDQTLVFITKGFDTVQNGKKDFVAIFFKDISNGATLALLSKFQNNITNIENKLLIFLHEHCQSQSWICEWFVPVVAQNSSYLRAGEKIEITAGIGSFSNRGQPKIFINRQFVPLNGDGIAVSKFPVSIRPGKHVVPIEVNYIDDEGKEQTIARNVEYTVVKE